MKVEFTEEAERDLENIERIIALDNARAAAQVLQNNHDTIERLVRGELSGPEARLSDGRHARSWPVPPYRIYYTRTGQVTQINRVYHQARRPIAG